MFPKLKSLPTCHSALSFLLVLIVTFTITAVVHGKTDHNKPHPHGALLKPYNPTNPFQGISLSRKEESLLLDGKPVTKQTMPSKDDIAVGAAGGSAICVQDVLAPSCAVWNQILDLNSYQKKVSKVNVSRNYFVKKLGHGIINIKTKMVLGVLPGYAYESYYDHKYHADQSCLTWTLDYDKTSDFDDVSGCWYVTEHPSGQHNACRVYYACDIKMKGSVPAPILNYISKAALKQATAWVKRESEAHPDATIPSEYATHKTIQKEKEYQHYMQQQLAKQ